MSTPDHLPALLAGVPSPDAPADVPKALTAFAKTVDEVLVAHDAAMTATVAQVDPDQLARQAVERTYAITWTTIS